MSFLQESILIEIEVPAGVSTDTILTTDLTDADELNLSEHWLHAVPVIIQRRSAAGVSIPITETVVITGDDLIINEGGTGFVLSEFYLVELIVGDISRATATSS